MGPLQLKRVLQKYVRVAPIWNLELPDQVIETTAEHPFYVVNREAWISTQMLEVGDNLVTDDGQVVPVISVQDAKRVETVYNFNIEEFHTYFVAAGDLGFSVWAHNAGPDYLGSNGKTYPRDYQSKNTTSHSAQFGSEGEARTLAMQMLGRPVTLGDNKLRSQDGVWQYRAKPVDTSANHVHLERLDARTGEVLQNWHLMYPPPRS
jgi:intein/homing endonuclease